MVGMNGERLFGRILVQIPTWLNAFNDNWHCKSSVIHEGGKGDCRTQDAHWLFARLGRFLTLVEGAVESIERSVVSQNEHRIMKIADPRNCRFQSRDADGIRDRFRAGGLKSALPRTRREA